VGQERETTNIKCAYSAAVKEVEIMDIKTGRGEKCVDYRVKGVRPRGRPKKTWSEVVKKNCHTQQVNEDGMNCSKWRKLTKDHSVAW